MVIHKTDRDWVYESGGSGGGVAVSKDGGKNRQKQNLDRSYGWPVREMASIRKYGMYRLHPSLSFPVLFRLPTSMDKPMHPAIDNVEIIPGNG
jgi:hypothetical protein